MLGYWLSNFQPGIGRFCQSNQTSPLARIDQPAFYHNSDSQIKSHSDFPRPSQLLYSRGCIKGVIVRLYQADRLPISQLFILLFNSCNAEIFLNKPWRPNIFFQLKIIINVLFRSFQVEIIKSPFVVACVRIWHERKLSTFYFIKRKMDFCVDIPWLLIKIRRS